MYMKKLLLFALLFTCAYALKAQENNYWSTHNDLGKITTDKAVARATFPKEFKLFDLNIKPLRQELFSIVGARTTKHSTIISLPNADGQLEKFEVVEASNFEPALQAKFPEIRAYSGRGVTDKSATLKISISPQGIQTMVFRTEKQNEFIEAYSSDHTVYAVFKSNRVKGQLPWTCSTEDVSFANNINNDIDKKFFAPSSAGNLKTLRLAQSVTAEYSNYFGATSSAQVNLVLAAINATLTRCNGCYEKDLAVHLNLIAATTNVIYYNPSTDPYDAAATGAGGTWNGQLQSTLTSVIGEANYDIGHLFGASGGGGNAGCIGCVCTNGSKGSGFTSPADGIPQGDNFDIDYVVHEVGHQLGGNHTFSMTNEGTGVNKEIGSGITIMGYAGITSQDVAPHSIDIYHEASIAQIQTNLASKTCPVTTTNTNATPVVNPVSNYTIPISTPFALTGSATDANSSDVLTYCWEQDDNASSSQTGANSVASITKSSGPNWISFSPSTSPTRYFPKLATILAGLNVSGPLPGGDAGANTEALSSVARTLHFRLTVRDNAPYSSTAPVSVGQTSFTNMTVTVSSAAGPFTVTSPNTAVTWGQGTQQTVTWNVASTNLSPVSCSSVNILLSTDGGQTFPTVLASGVANNGSALVTLPSTTSSTCRVMIQSVGNIFFDISNSDFTIGTATGCTAPASLAASSITQTSATVSWGAVSGANSYDVDYKATSSSTWINAATATTATSVNLTGLSASTTYDYRVRTNCASSSSAYTSAQFTTSGASTCPSTYDAGAHGSFAAAVLIPKNTDVKGTLKTKSESDYYKFTVTTGGTLTVNLTTLPNDYDIRLYNSAQTQVGISQNGGTTNEAINYTAAAGTYYVRVYVYSGTSSTACYTLNVTFGTATKGIENVSSDKGLNVYPNPALSVLNVSAEKVAANSSIKVYDNFGKLVITQKANQGSNQLDVRKLLPGVYFIKLEDAEGVTYTSRFIKQ